MLIIFSSLLHLLEEEVGGGFPLSRECSTATSIAETSLLLFHQTPLFLCMNGKNTLESGKGEGKTGLKPVSLSDINHSRYWAAPNK